MILFGLISLTYHNLGSQKCPFTKPKEYNKIPPTLRPAKNPGTANLGTPNHEIHFYPLNLTLEMSSHSVRKTK